MNYKKTRKTLNSLNDLLLEIEQKQRERKGAIAYNGTTPFSDLNYDLKELSVEIQEMELEFKRMSREL